MSEKTQASKLSDWTIAFVMIIGLFAGAIVLVAVATYFFGSYVAWGTILVLVAAKWAWDIVSKDEPA